jgi:hypothetical protein
MDAVDHRRLPSPKEARFGPGAAMTSGQYVLLLVLCVLLTLGTGLALLVGGRRALEGLSVDPAVARPVVAMIVVIYQLVTLGVLALTSPIAPPPPPPLQHLVTKLGTVLLIVAVGYAVALHAISATAERRWARPWVVPLEPWQAEDKSTPKADSKV